MLNSTGNSLTATSTLTQKLKEIRSNGNLKLLLEGNNNNDNLNSNKDNQNQNAQDRVQSQTQLQIQNQNAQDRVQSQTQLQIQQNQQQQSQTQDKPIDKVTLQVHCGLGFGDVTGFNVGGVDGRWEFFIAGEPLAQLSSAEHEAEKGQAVVSPQVFEMVKKHIIDYSELESGNVHIKAIQSCECQMPNRHNRICDMINIENRTRVIEILKQYIPTPCLKGMYDGEKWGNEMRTITTLFINLRGVNFNGEHALENVQTIVSEVESGLLRVEGILCRFSVDDKGTVILCAFGLPLFQHENDPLRAIQFSLDLRKRMTALGIESSIGISYGPAFCGMVGGKIRCEYTVHGTNVNLAARCMVAAKGIGILVEENVYNHVKKQVVWGESVSKVVKGFAKPKILYSVKGMSMRFIFQKDEEDMEGRQEEMKVLKGYLDKLCSTPPVGGSILIQGPAGYGKTALTYAFANMCANDTSDVCINVFWSVASETSHASPFHMWTGIFSHIFQLDYTDTPEEQLNKIREMVPENQQENIPLFKTLFPSLGGKATVEGVSAENKGYLLQELLFDTLKNAIDNLMSDNAGATFKKLRRAGSVVDPDKESNSEYDPTNVRIVLVLEDIHWADAGSLNFLTRCMTDLENVFFYLSGRPCSTGEIYYPFTPLINQTLTLMPLERCHIEEMIKKSENCAKVIDSLTDFLYEKSNGNPLYARELLNLLKNTQAMSTKEEGGIKVCKMEVNPEDVDVPDGIHALMIAKLDGMPPNVQLIVKVASVLGTRFSRDKIVNIAMKSTSFTEKDIYSFLTELEAQKVIQFSGDNGFPEYVFLSSLFREAVYNNLTQKTRKKIHNDIATYIEMTYEDYLEPYLHELAMHCEKADRIDDAFNYLHKAGYHFMEIRLYRDAIDEFEKLLKMADIVACQHRYDLARIHVLLGKAYLNIEELEPADSNFLLALGLLNYEPPTDTCHVIFDTFRLSHKPIIKIHPDDLLYIQDHEKYLSEKKPKTIDFSPTSDQEENEQDKDKEDFVNPVLLAAQAYESLITVCDLVDFKHGLHIRLCAYALASYQKCSPEFARAVIHLAELYSKDRKTREKAFLMMEQALDILKHLNHAETKIVIEYKSALMCMGICKIQRALELLNKANWISDFLRHDRWLIDCTILNSTYLIWSGDIDRACCDVEALKSFISDPLQYLRFFLNIILGRVFDIDKLYHSEDNKTQQLEQQFPNLGYPLAYGAIYAYTSLEQTDVAYGSAFDTLNKILVFMKEKDILSFIETIYVWLLFYEWWKCSVDCLLEDPVYNKQCVSIGKKCLDLIERYSKCFPFCLPMYCVCACIYNRVIGNKKAAIKFLNYYEDSKKVTQFPILECMALCEKVHFSTDSDIQHQCIEQATAIYEECHIIQLSHFIEKAGTSSNNPYE